MKVFALCLMLVVVNSNSLFAQKQGRVDDVVSRAFIEYSLGNFSAAKQLLQDEKTRLSDSLKYLRLSILAKIYYHDKNFDALTLLFQQADGYNRPPKSLYYPMQLIRSAFLYQQGKVDSAFSLCEILMDDITKNPAILDSVFIATVYTNYSYYALLPGIDRPDFKLQTYNLYLDKAINIFESAHGDSSLLAYPYLYKALAFYSVKKDTTLIRHYLRKVIELYPITQIDDDFNNGIGFLLYTLRHYNDIEHLFKDQKESVWLGIAKLELGHKEEGVKILDKYFMTANQSIYSSAIAHLVLADKISGSDPEKANYHFKQSTILRTEYSKTASKSFFTLLDYDSQIMGQMQRAMITMEGDEGTFSKKVMIVLILILLVSGGLIFFGLKLLRLRRNRGE